MKVNLDLSPAEQTRDLGLELGDIIQSKTANGEDRLTLLWRGDNVVVWRRQYRRYLAKWEDCGEVTDYREFHQVSKEWYKPTANELEVESLRELCLTAYKVVGAVNGPHELLDNLASAASGNPLPHSTESGLSWTPRLELTGIRRKGSLELSPICKELLDSIEWDCVPSVPESANTVNDLTTRAKAMLNATIEWDSSQYMTLVFRGLSQDEIPVLTGHSKLSYAGVGHAFYERDELQRKLDETLPF